MKKNAQEADEFEQQVGLTKNILISFPFHFHVFLSIIQSVTWMV